MTEKDGIQVLCAWCDSKIEPGTADAVLDLPSHGICQKCYAKMLREISRLGSGQSDETGRD